MPIFKTFIHPSIFITWAYGDYHKLCQKKKKRKEKKNQKVTYTYDVYF